eukprot:11200550-Lingulodinium_polyedra.AAC.1
MCSLGQSVHRKARSILLAARATRRVSFWRAAAARSARSRAATSVDGACSKFLTHCIGGRGC